MIKTDGLTKRFDGITALRAVTCEIADGSVYGIIGTNGAGKSTFLRLLAGVLLADEGTVQIDGEAVFEHPPVKSRFFYISDDQFFFPNTTPRQTAAYYAMLYPKFAMERFLELLSRFNLDADRKVNTFSKGMKKQLSVLCALCSNTDYIFCDETFDGLDPVMRQAVKSMFAQAVAERSLTVVVASHNLREIEDICDHVGLLHQGGILFSRDLEELKLGLQKIHFVSKTEVTPELLADLEILHFQRSGSLYTITARGTPQQVQQRIEQLSPLFCELLPLTLEEIFISETEVVGYDIQKLIS